MSMSSRTEAACQAGGSGKGSWCSQCQPPQRGSSRGVAQSLKGQTKMEDPALIARRQPPARQSVTSSRQTAFCYKLITYSTGDGGGITCGEATARALCLYLSIFPGGRAASPAITRYFYDGGAACCRVAKEKRGRSSSSYFSRVVVCFLLSLSLALSRTHTTSPLLVLLLLLTLLISAVFHILRQPS